jgi:hypothetical protein
MTDKTTRCQCIACLSPINTGARKCPECHSNQWPATWKDSIKDYSTVLGLVTALVSITTFALSGLPTLYSTLTRNKAIVKVDFSSGSSSPGAPNVTRVVFVNYGLRRAVVSTDMRCYSLNRSGEMVKDKSGQSSPELFVTKDDTRLDGETTRIVAYDSLGGLPVPEDELATVEIAGVECTLWYADIATDANSEGVKRNWMKFRTLPPP